MERRSRSDGVSTRNTLPIAAAVSLMVAAVAWAVPFAAPMVWSYWASGIWCAIIIGAVAVYGKQGLWLLLGAPLVLWHIAFALSIYIVWR
jgi:hypothetical protein